MSDLIIAVSEPTRTVTLILTPVQAADILTDLDRAAVDSAVGSGILALRSALTTVTSGESYKP